jgi:hypothetical protein
LLSFLLFAHLFFCLLYSFVESACGGEPDAAAARADALRGVLCFDVRDAAASAARGTGRHHSHGRLGDGSAKQGGFPACLELLPCSAALLVALLRVADVDERLFRRDAIARVFCDVVYRGTRWRAAQGAAPRSGGGGGGGGERFGAATPSDGSALIGQLTRWLPALAARTQQDVALTLSTLACFSVTLRRSRSRSDGAAAAEQRAPATFAAALWESMPASRRVMLRLVAGQRAAPTALSARGAAAAARSSAAPSPSEPGDAPSAWELSREHDARLWHLDGAFALGARLRAARAPDNFVLRAAEACGGVESSAVRPPPPPAPRRPAPVVLPVRYELSGNVRAVPPRSRALLGTSRPTRY